MGVRLTVGGVCYGKTIRDAPNLVSGRNDFDRSRITRVRSEPPWLPHDRRGG